MRRRLVLSAVAVLVASGLGGTAHAVTTRGPASDLAPISYSPQVATDPATGVSATTATLDGNLTAPSPSDTYGFQYGTSAAYGSWAPAGGPDAPVAEAGPQNVSQSVSGLKPATTYHFRAVLVAVVRQGNVPHATVYVGGDETFTTPPAAVSPLPPSSTSPTPPPAPAPPTPLPPTPTPTPTTPTPTTPTPTAPPTATTPIPPPTPVVGETTDARTVSGTVSVTPAGSSTPVSLQAGQSIPLDTVVDATHGVAQVTEALPGGATQSATVWAGRFTMTQTRSGHTTFHLMGAPACRAGSRAHAARKPPVLWAHDHDGRYSTQGLNSVATVRGTVWETIESCAGTRTVVRRGVVSVRDVRTGRTVLVRAGHSVLIPR